MSKTQGGWSNWMLKLRSDQSGAVANTAAFVAVITGVLVLVFGLILADPVLSTATTSGSNPNIGSFAGARSVNDLIPFIYYGVIALVGVGLMGLGGLSVIRGRM